MSEVDDDDLRPHPEDVQPAGRPLRGRAEVAQSRRDLLDRCAQSARSAGGGKRIRDVVAGQAGDGDRHVGDGQDGRRSLTVHFEQRAVPDDVGPSAALDMPPNERTAAVTQREERDMGPNEPRRRRDVEVVGVEDDPAVGLRDSADRRLDFGQLWERMDALQVEVVRRDVGQDADVVRLVADAAQHDPAAGGLEDRDLDVGAAENLRRPAGTGPVTGIDHPLVDEDPIGCRRPDMASRQQQDVGDEAGDGALAVGPTDRHDRDPAIDVADQRRRRRPGLRDAFRPALDQPRPTAPQLRASSRGDPALREREGRFRDGRRPFGASPWPGGDPVARVGRAMDGHAADALVVFASEAPGPRHDPRNVVRPVAGRDPRRQPNERVGIGRPLAVPRPPPADGDLDLDRRLEPVDVRPLEQADLDQAHGPRRIARRPLARLAR